MRIECYECHSEMCPCGMVEDHNEEMHLIIMPCEKCRRESFRTGFEAGKVFSKNKEEASDE